MSTRWKLHSFVELSTHRRRLVNEVGTFEMKGGDVGLRCWEKFDLPAGWWPNLGLAAAALAGSTLGPYRRDGQGHEIMRGGQTIRGGLTQKNDPHPDQATAPKRADCH
jgi:hypothetical protein